MPSRKLKLSTLKSSKRLIPPNLRGMKLPKKHLPKLLLRKQKKKQLNGRANTSDFMRNGTPTAVA